MIKMSDSATAIHPILAEKQSESPKRFFIQEWTPAIKGMAKNMVCRDQKFTLGEIVSKSDNEKIEICTSGFHVCGNILAVNKFYNFCTIHQEYLSGKQTVSWNSDGYRFFNVSIKGNVDFDDRGLKFAAQHIRIDSEIDMTNGTFTDGKDFIKVRNNKVHSDEGYAMSLYGINYKVTDGVITYAEFIIPGITVKYSQEIFDEIKRTDTQAADTYEGLVLSLFSNFYERNNIIPATQILNNVQVVSKTNYNDITQVQNPRYVQGYIAPQQYAHQPYPAPFWFAPATPMAGFGVRYF